MSGATQVLNPATASDYGVRPRPPQGHLKLRRFFKKVTVYFTLTIYTLLSPFGYGAFAILTAIPFRDAKRRQRVLLGAIQRGFRTLHWWTRLVGLIDFHPDETVGELTDEPCVVVSNHPTFTDITALMSTFGAMSTVVKPAIYRRWFLKPLVNGAGFFEGITGDPIEMQRVIDDAIARLKDGQRVVLFPEGTRSPEGGMGRFGRSPFEVAIRAGVPVAPVFIEVGPTYLSKEHGVTNPPPDGGRMRLHVLPLIHPGNRTGRELRDHVEALLRSHVAAQKALPPATAEVENGRLPRD